jgi:ABC-type multidrug transport system ATPase subunit
LGERRRTAVAYETITDPHLIFLDDPIKHLNSVDQLTLINILKKEALRGKTIITTISQTSQEVFLEFNRLLLLFEGREYYQGPTKEITQYLTSLSINTPKYTN